MWLLTIETPDGPYRLSADWVVACDGARSSLRQMVGAEFAGQVFEDQFLIADVKMTAAFPTERWFWFDPPFHAGRSALLHKQPDDIWRIDLQLNPMPIPRSKSCRRTCGRASRACSATTSSISNGSRSTNSSAGGWTSSSMAA